MATLRYGHTKFATYFSYGIVVTIYGNKYFARGPTYSYGRMFFYGLRAEEFSRVTASVVKAIK